AGPVGVGRRSRLDGDRGRGDLAGPTPSGSRRWSAMVCRDREKARLSGPSRHDWASGWSVAHRLEVVRNGVVRDVRAEHLARHVRAAVVEAGPDARLDQFSEWL